MLGETLKEKSLSLVAAVTDRDSAAGAASLKRGADIHYEDDFPLRCAVYLGYEDMAELLLKNGANVHVGGEELLFMAIKARDTALIKVLLTHGADAQAVLDNKKGKLDQESLDIISGIQSRDAKTAFEKHSAAMKEKIRKPVRIGSKPKSP